MKTLFLCGAGNSEGVRLALNLNAAEGRWDRIVLLDDDPSKHGRTLLGVEIIGSFSVLESVSADESEAVNLVARTTRGRKAARDRIAATGVPFTSLVAAGVDLLGASIPHDAIIYPNTTIGPEVTLGAGTVVFMGAVVGHESHVGAGCVIAANSVLNARVELGDGVYMGTNATVLPEITVGAGATIGAGSAVVQDVPAGATAMGVPAQILVDPRALASDASAGGVLAVDATDEGPEEGVEDAIAAAFEAVLERAPVSRSENFFDLGGNSLKALQVSETLRRVSGLEVALVDLFRFPTIQTLARHVARPAGPPRRAADPAPVARAVPPAAAGASSFGGGSLVAEITSIFQAVLESDRVGPETHFFDGGGDTFRAHRACQEIQDLTGEPLCFMQIARYPTARDLARHLDLSVGQPPTCPAQGVMNRMLHRHEWHRG